MDGRTFDSGVAESVALLPGPPDYWSYSTLKEVEACARRYILGHATYPDLWAGQGYPDRPSPAALFGDIVHDSLERIIGALVAADCATSDSSEACDVLRELGGYSAVALQAMANRLSKLAGNPRLDADGFTRLQQYLEDRIPEARAVIQGFLQRMALVPRLTAATRGGEGLPVRRRLGVGSHPETPLQADKLRVRGRVDLITVQADRVDIVDHKTGARDPSHLDQLLFYAMLWDRDEVANQARTQLGTLMAAYPTDEVCIPAPDANKLAEFVVETAERVGIADAALSADEPIATTGEQCTYCRVRSLCDAYWQAVAPDPADLRDGTWFDYEGMVGSQNGVHSWWMLDMNGRRQVLLRTPPNRTFTPGQRLRIVGLRREVDPDVDAVVAVLSTNSEVFVVVGGES